MWAVVESRISPTLRRLQKDPPRCKAKNPEILALFSRLPWVTNQQDNTMKLCNHVTWYIGGAIHEIFKPFSKRPTVPFHLAPEARPCVLQTCIYGSNTPFETSFFENKKDLVPFWLHMFMEVLLLIICSQHFFESSFVNQTLCSRVLCSKKVCARHNCSPTLFNSC